MITLQIMFRVVDEASSMSNSYFVGFWHNINYIDDSRWENCCGFLKKIKIKIKILEYILEEINFAYSN